MLDNGKGVKYTRYMEAPYMPRLIAGIKGTPSGTPTVDGIAVRFTRRRYSNRTYTWVSALLDGTWTELGDPWPSIKVSDNEIRMAIARVKNYPTCGYREQGGEHWQCVRPVGHRGDHSPFVVDTENADKVA